MEIFEIASAVLSFLIFIAIIMLFFRLQNIAKGKEKKMMMIGGVGAMFFTILQLGFFAIGMVGGIKISEFLSLVCVAVFIRGFSIFLIEIRPFLEKNNTSNKTAERNA